MKDRRKLFLEQAHTTEKEVYKYQGEECFKLDGHIIIIPKYLCSIISYRNYLFSAEYKV